jgi:hypothetical protein
MQKYLILILLFAGLNAWGQSIYNNYSWNTIPATGNTDTIKSVNGAKITLERHITELYANKEGRFEELNIFHRRIKVETHAAVNNFNKIYVGLHNVIEIVGIKARFISPDGKITELPQESIRQVDNLENKGNYKTFAIEGAVEGGVVEYYYIVRRKFKPYGTLVLQDDEPRANVEVIFCFPDKLEYQMKGYNNFPAVEKSTPSEGMTKLAAHINYVPVIRDEKYAFVEANKMRCEYCMTYNRYNGALRTHSWAKIGDYVNNSVWTLQKSELKAARKLIKKIDNPQNDLESRIRTIENWVKSEVAISEEMPDDFPIDKTIQMKQTTLFGATRLTSALLQAANIPFELVMTSNKEKKPFDPSFNSWNFLDEYLIYFPQVNKALKPDNAEFRLGVIPSEYAGCYGLFMHPLTYSDKLSTFAYDVKKIPALTSHDNRDSMIVRTTLDVNTMSLNARFYREMTGRNGAVFQSFWSNMNADKQKEMVQRVFDMGGQSVTVNNYQVSNASPHMIGVKPILFDVNVSSNGLVEMAGNDLLVKIGETIGEQSQLYQTEARQLPVQLDLLHGYYRRIEFVVPQGYKITNAETLKMNVEMKVDGKVSCAFTSDYELKGNTLVIVSREYYNHDYYPRERFEAFRQVINAAADFNKKTLVLAEIK